MFVSFSRSIASDADSASKFRIACGRLIQAPGLVVKVNHRMVCYDVGSSCYCPGEDSQKLRTKDQKVTMWSGSACTSMKTEKRRCQRSSTFVPTSPSGRYKLTSIVSDQPEQVAERDEGCTHSCRFCGVRQSTWRLTSLFYSLLDSQSKITIRNLQFREQKPICILSAKYETAASRDAMKTWPGCMTMMDLSLNMLWSCHRRFENIVGLLDEFD